MRSILTIFAALLSFPDLVYSVELSNGRSIPDRPVLIPAPYGPAVSRPHSPPRDDDKYCFVPGPCKDGEDSAPRILKAFQKCNDGGTVVLDKVYTISSPLNLTFLKHVDVVITGEVHMDDSDVYYWADNSFKFPFQNTSAIWMIGGEDVNIYGDLTNDQSLIHGHGQAFWEENQTNKTVGFILKLRRPLLVAIEGLHGGSMSNLRMKNPAFWFNIIANSSDVIISDMHLEAKSENDVKIANSDGWDTYRSERIVIQDSIIDNTDDCVSFKPNSTDIVVQNLICDGSHGISIGSLGQYRNITDIVEDLHIFNISMSNASDGARIKVWPGIETDFQSDLNGGGGLGRVKNVTYDTFYHYNNDRAITITQCYGQSNQTLCNEFPANLTIDDITMKNFWGVTSSKYDPEAGTLVCSAADRCSNINLHNITVTVPSGEPPVYECSNVDESLLENITCVHADDDRDTGQG
ncbi:unnamed protein product [Clonostachys solani]|uniref:galacturonan 1,4-alpha-galacturonidase n=1 Tax=Clonostachys solani TaxID=160281 RepID=A0A9N9Z815_9HYPO|nr:unnamed protein product [Clonostachys solani]